MVGGRDHSPVGEPLNPGHACLAVTSLTANGSPGEGGGELRVGEAIPNGAGGHPPDASGEAAVGGAGVPPVLLGTYNRGLGGRKASS